MKDKAFTVNCRDCNALIWRVHSYRGRCADCEVRRLRAEVQDLKRAQLLPFQQTGGAAS